MTPILCEHTDLMLTLVWPSNSHRCDTGSKFKPSCLLINHKNSHMNNTNKQTNKQTSQHNNHHKWERTYNLCPKMSSAQEYILLVVCVMYHSMWLWQLCTSFCTFCSCFLAESWHFACFPVHVFTCFRCFPVFSIVFTSLACFSLFLYFSHRSEHSLPTIVDLVQTPNENFYHWFQRLSNLMLTVGFQHGWMAKWSNQSSDSKSLLRQENYGPLRQSLKLWFEHCREGWTLTAPWP